LKTSDLSAVLSAFLFAAGASEAIAQEPTRMAIPSPVPDSTGWGTHVLAVAEAPDGGVWVGTYGQGIYLSRDGTGRDWENLRSRDSAGISWDFVHAFAFAPGEVWYGTIGNGWGISRDGGRTWRNWTFDELGPRWLYVAPGGMAVKDDTVFVATADGLRITGDGGETWRDVTEADGLSSRYLLGLAVGESVRVRHLAGVDESADGGRTWRRASQAGTGERPPPPPEPATGSALVREIRQWQGRFRDYAAPAGAVAEPGDRAHFRFRRPIGPDGNAYVDQTYAYGSTMGGNFQQHQGVEFNNPDGTPVLAAGPGTVVLAGRAEAGALTVTVRHDTTVTRNGTRYRLYSTYYHNSSVGVKEGERVRAGQEIARVGNTGRATNDHVHLELSASPTDSLRAIVDSSQRFPPYTTNPELWVEPLPGTGIVAGQVFGADGAPVQQARIYGIAKREPTETPFSFAETYGDKGHSHPLYGEHFAVGDVPAGSYVVGTEIGGKRVLRRITVAPGKLTWVVFKP
jgi:murein DD-endopeptidase MepM/ murein hydrolase activator NlpD